MNLQPYKDFTDYVLSKIDEHDKHYLVASELKREIKYATKNNRSLSWFWLYVAKELFELFNIKDERINISSIKKEIKFVHSGEKYNVKINLNDDWRQSHKNARLVQNTSGMEDEKFIVETIKRYIDKGVAINCEQVFLHYSYLVILLES